MSHAKNAFNVVKKYFSDEVALRLETIANAAKALMQEILVVDFSKVT